MPKQVKSVRLDEGLITTFFEFDDLLNEMFGYRLSFSSFVNEAVSEYLKEQCSHWSHIMETQSVVEPLANGKFKRIEFTEEQIKRMKELSEKSECIWAITQME